MNTNVIIAGAGPVGMTLALELARYGVKSILLERNETTTRHPKMDLTNGRSMELYARLGVVEALRDVGVPRENSFDISWITRLAGYELFRYRYPSSTEFEANSRAINDGSFPAEAPLRVSQIDIEPVLKRFVDESPLIDVRFGVAFEEIVEESSGSISVLVKNQRSGETDVLSGMFLAGCDGGGSRVRRKLGIELDGEEAVAGAFMVHFRSTDTELLQRWGGTWHYQNGAGTLIAQNDKDTWTLQAWLPPGEDGLEWKAEDVLENWVGQKFNYEILQANPWAAHFVVAKQYYKGRAILAGDSAHQFIPTGGYGMNSGIADAIGLAWVLTANVQGWGDMSLVDAYEAERRPTAWWHLEASRRHFLVRQAFTMAYMAAGDIDSDTEVASSNRSALAEKCRMLGNAENESYGVELGYRYDSDIILGEAGNEEIDPLVYTPSTEPGRRLPHVYLENGQSIYSLLGNNFNLLVCEDSIDVSSRSLLDEALASTLAPPCEIVVINNANAKKVLASKYVLVRPDLHIAWRSDQITSEFASVLLKAIGKAA
ncbi:MAG: FAD-dependent monooxygenase [Zhongshania sp.]|uniref:FAD-dependent monooxygenase n=1 Tax=Zhongshania sp. TaxID=1971902 RepID=UPI0026309224|nr:FAD-dependent monooxygenase [Zhongshania sp.]MDF1690848.1 FAD-dependent monooxygenase [Zhongshania sp.]